MEIGRREIGDGRRVGDNAFGWDWFVVTGGSGECGPEACRVVFVAGLVVCWLECGLGFENKPPWYRRLGRSRGYSMCCTVLGRFGVVVSEGGRGTRAWQKDVWIYTRASMDTPWLCMRNGDTVAFPHCLSTQVRLYDTAENWYSLRRQTMAWERILKRSQVDTKIHDRICT